MTTDCLFWVLLNKLLKKGGSEMGRTLIIVIFATLYLLVTFFGMGPVLMADGSVQERMITLIVVILIYVLLTVAFRRLLRRK